MANVRGRQRLSPGKPSGNPSDTTMAASDRNGGATMTGRGHLWAIGFDDMGRAEEFRDEIATLASEKHDLVLLDAAVAVRFNDGCFTLNGEPFPVVIKTHGGSVAHLLACLALGARRCAARPSAPCWTALRHRGHSRNQRRLRARSGVPDQARHFCTVCSGRSRQHGSYIAWDTRAGRKVIEDQRRFGAGEADSVHPSRAQRLKPERVVSSASPIDEALPVPSLPRTRYERFHLLRRREFFRRNCCRRCDSRPANTGKKPPSSNGENVRAR